MKKLIALLLALTLILGLAACGGSADPADTDTPADSGAADPGAGGNGGAASPNESGSAAGSSSGEPVYGGSLTVYFPQLMSFYSQEAPDFATYTLWYEGLFGLDWANTETQYRVETAKERAGQLADTWEIDEENKQFIVHLREDVYFQELDPQYDYYGGRNLVANDVKWSYDRLLGTGSGFDQPVESMVDWRGLFSMVDSIETDGDYTVIFNFNDISEVKQASFITNGFLVHIVGPEYGDLTEDQIADWHYACGTGPFIISDCVEGQYITFVKNEKYYDYDERYPENRLPYLDSVTLVLINDTATILSNFIAGELDIVGANNGDVFSDSEAAQIASALDASEYSVWKKNSNTYSIGMKQTIEPLTDIRVRQAMQYAIDLESITYQLYGYDTMEICGYFGAASGWDVDWSDEELWASYTTYDPELAKDLLEEAGYGDGFEFTLVYDPNMDSNVYLMAQEYLAQVGITMNLDPQSEPSERQAKWNDPNNNCCATVDLGTNGLSNGLSKVDSANSNYVMGEEARLDELVAELRAQQTVDGQAAAALALDQYYIDQHYSVIVSPYLHINTYTSANVGGWNGYNFYDAYACTTILPRIWNVNGAQ